MELYLAEGRVRRSATGRISLKRYLNESTALLSQILTDIPSNAHTNEAEFIHSFVPRFASALGYAESETLYNVGTGVTSADVVLAPAAGARPWIVIEIKNRVAPIDKYSLRQLHSLKLAFDSRYGIAVSGAQLAILDGEAVEILNFSDLTDAKITGWLSRLGRWAQQEKKVERGSEQIESLIAQVEAATSSQDKGRTLEELAAFLFSSVPSLHCKHRNLRTRSSEIDLVIEYQKSTFSIPLFEELGRYFFIECKNWSSPVGAAPVRDFIGKMLKSRTRLGILFAKNGITGEGTGLDALREIQSAYDRDGIFLLVLSLSDLGEIKNGGDFIALLDLKSDKLRFDF